MDEAEWSFFLLLCHTALFADETQCMIEEISLPTDILKIILGYINVTFKKTRMPLEKRQKIYNELANGDTYFGISKKIIFDFFSEISLKQSEFMVNKTQNVYVAMTFQAKCFSFYDFMEFFPHDIVNIVVSYLDEETMPRGVDDKFIALPVKWLFSMLFPSWNFNFTKKDSTKYMDVKRYGGCASCGHMGTDRFGNPIPREKAFEYEMERPDDPTVLLVADLAHEYSLEWALKRRNIVTLCVNGDYWRMSRTYEDKGKVYKNIDIYIVSNFNVFVQPKSLNDIVEIFLPEQRHLAVYLRIRSGYPDTEIKKNMTEYEQWEEEAEEELRNRGY